MESITYDNVYEHEQYGKILEKLEKHPEGLTLGELVYLLTTKKVSYKLEDYSQKFKNEPRQDIFKQKAPKQRINYCLKKLRTDEQVLLVEKKRKKYFLKSFSNDLQSFFVNKNVIEDQIESIKQMRNKENKQFSLFVSSNIHVFSFDSNINNIINENEKYKIRLNKIKKKFEESLNELDQLRHEVFVNEVDSGFVKGHDELGFSGERYRRKTNISVIMHTWNDLVNNYYF